MTYLGDRSAFDVYVEFFNNSNDKGFIGIEVKYHEKLKNKPAETKDRCFEVASAMGCLPCMADNLGSDFDQLFPHGSW